jgi:hypothetical protein
VHPDQVPIALISALVGALQKDGELLPQSDNLIFRQ